MEYLSIHKLKDWRYENEWRLIYDMVLGILDRRIFQKIFGCMGKIFRSFDLIG